VIEPGKELGRKDTMKHHGVNPYQAAVGAIVASALCATLLTAAPASAEERTTPPAVSDQQARALDAGVDVSTRVFDVEAAISAGGDPGVVDEFAEGYAAGGGTVRGLRDTPSAVADSAASSLLRCSGKNSFDVTGFQANLYLNSCVSNDVIGKLNQGAGVAGIAGVVASETGIGAAALVAAGVLAIAGGALTSCNAKGRGTVSHNIPGSAIAWCNSQ